MRSIFKLRYRTVFACVAHWLHIEMMNFFKNVMKLKKDSVLLRKLNQRLANLNYYQVRNL